jgi:hypothetical protein
MARAALIMRKSMLDTLVYCYPFMRKAWEERRHPRTDNGRFTNGAEEGRAVQPKGANVKNVSSVDSIKKILAIASLEKKAVPMMAVEYSEEEYNRLFKMGANQFSELGRKDDGGRQSYIGAAYQTLTDPVIVIKEGDADVYIKSFIRKKGISTFISVEKDKEDGRFIVANHMRHKDEVIKKIKWADGVVYLKDSVGGSPARMDKRGYPHAKSSHTSTVSPDLGEKSRGPGGEKDD